MLTNVQREELEIMLLTVKTTVERGQKVIARIEKILETGDLNNGTK